jgi:hypothetical protein
VHSHALRPPTTWPLIACGPSFAFCESETRVGSDGPQRMAQSNPDKLDNLYAQSFLPQPRINRRAGLPGASGSELSPWNPPLSSS